MGHVGTSKSQENLNFTYGQTYQRSRERDERLDTRGIARAGSLNEKREILGWGNLGHDPVAHIDFKEGEGENAKGPADPFVDDIIAKQVVRQNWCTANDIDNPFFSFKEKLKKLKTALTSWSKEVYGDIFKQLIIREDIVKIKEKLFEEDPSSLNRVVMQKAQAEFKKYLLFEEEYWKQKAGFTWFEKGERNTRFFHSLVKGRRKR
ncbi:hypothetical protein KY290_024879 [Solanum tuberosum]|uniref:Uncharacterized protein n=1 Tax=Solanum tuberosum TaxID=4113 RepID=A0ABQ7US68_SOLTU|nr:hypothetical protein KY284_023733 [Solanum tuberosum]KAH0754609.1 hypothetical protein KY290_024879 [Solanum tuberosum]